MTYAAWAVKRILLGALFVAAFPVCAGTQEYAVQVSAQLDRKAPAILLRWVQDSRMAPERYQVFRKLPQERHWGDPIASLPGTATQFRDTEVQVGQAYEYQVYKSTPHYSGYGYLLAGIDLPLVEDRGKMILVIDDTHAVALAAELKRLEQDLSGDGWQVIRKMVRRNDSVLHVKSLIQAEYRADPTQVKAVFLFGHVPVPYSGEIVPDGHTPHHFGCWPADVFYGDMDGTWTDHQVNNTRASDPVNRNVPGDGKFDQSEIPSTVELQVGRVDLSNLPGRKEGRSTFPSEQELLRQYLNKSHHFRHGRWDLPRRALVHDSFGIRNGEAFAASGYRNFAPFVGPENVVTLARKGEWIPNLRSNKYLWAYGCGSGSYTSIAGLGNTGSYQDGTTVELVEGDIQAVFVLLFGSWLGDWDSEDNILRSVLATSSYGLTSAWSGRPHWFMHHMAMGETIGFSTRLTQNNSRQGPYKTERNSAAGLIHIALMGDPALRMHPVKPASGLQGERREEGLLLSWTPSPDRVLGYHLYKGSKQEGPFRRITETPLQGTRFLDKGAPLPGAVYMVRALKLEETPSGTYTNASQGSFFEMAPRTGPAVEFTQAAGQSGAPETAVQAPEQP